MNKVPKKRGAIKLDNDTYRRVKLIQNAEFEATGDEPTMTEVMARALDVLAAPIAAPKQHAGHSTICDFSLPVPLEDAIGFSSATAGLDRDVASIAGILSSRPEFVRPLLRLLEVMDPQSKEVFRRVKPTKSNAQQGRDAKRIARS